MKKKGKYHNFCVQSFKFSLIIHTLSQGSLQNIEFQPVILCKNHFSINYITNENTFIIYSFQSTFQHQFTSNICPRTSISDSVSAPASMITNHANNIAYRDCSTNCLRKHQLCQRTIRPVLRTAFHQSVF